MHTSTAPRAARGRAPIACASTVELPDARPGEDRQTALLPVATAAWRAHVRARDAAARNPTRAKATKAEVTFARVVEIADTIIEAPLPQTADGLRALVEAIAMSHDGGCLDNEDPAHRDLRRLLSACCMVLGVCPPDGHAGL